MIGPIRRKPAFAQDLTQIRIEGDGNADMIRQAVDRTRMHEEFQGGQRQGSGHVHDGRPAMIPPPGIEAGAISGHRKGGMPRGHHPPRRDAHEKTP